MYSNVHVLFFRLLHLAYRRVRVCWLVNYLHLIFIFKYRNACYIIVFNTWLFEKYNFIFRIVKCLTMISFLLNLRKLGVYSSFFTNYAINCRFYSNFRMFYVVAIASDLANKYGSKGKIEYRFRFCSFNFVFNSILHAMPSFHRITSFL